MNPQNSPSAFSGTGASSAFSGTNGTNTSANPSAFSGTAGTGNASVAARRGKSRPDLVLQELAQGMGDLERLVKGPGAAGGMGGGAGAGGIPRKIQRQAMPPTPMYKA